jgi:hypothetical protein
MAMLKKKQRAQITELLQNGNLLEQLNSLLEKNGLEGVRVDALKLALRSENRSGVAALADVCPNGRPPQPVITSSGTIRWVCTED